MSDTYKPPARRPLPTFFLVFAAFSAGAFADRSGWLPGRQAGPPRLDPAFSPVWEAWDKVDKHYVDRAKVDPDRMRQAAIHGMLQTLGDVGHTAHLSPKAAGRLQENLTGEMQGIGVVISRRGNEPTVVQTMPGSPARSSGLRPGDVLLEVDGAPVKGPNMGKVLDGVRGPAGSTVKLRVRRGGKDKPVDLTVERATVRVPEVGWQALPGAPVAHLKIRSFSKQTHPQLRKALAAIRRQGLKGIIVDLRGNGGGLKEQALAVASEFLKKGQVVFLEQDAAGARTEQPVTAEGTAQDLPLCVLINGGTGSSAEILAGALQDHGRARLVGKRTVGTGTVLRQYTLSDGSALLLAVYQWLTPNGRTIWHKGIGPDKGMEVDLPTDAESHVPDPETRLTEAEFRRLKDTQLLKAFEVLKPQVR
jgi:carboxyl-terminal processing protease